MKKIMIALAVLFASFAAFSEDVAPKDIKTLDGTVYEKSTVTKVEADGITVNYDAGIAKLMFVNLPADIQQQYHYDPKALAASQAANAAQQSIAAAEQLKHHQLKFSWIGESNHFGGVVRHSTYDELATKITTKDKNLNNSAAELKQDLDDIPKGGQIWYEIRRSTVEAANPQYFTIIVFDSKGNEICRTTGEDTVAETPDSGTSGSWWCYMHIDLPEIKALPLKVRIVDSLQNISMELLAN